MPVINNTQSLVAGVQRDYIDTWRQKMPEFKASVDCLVRWMPSTSIRHAQYAFKEVVPAVKLWNYNTARTKDVFKDVVQPISIYPYSLNLPWNNFDAEDDQLGAQDMHIQVQSSVKRYGQLPIRLLAEYLNATASLNPTLVNAYDGVSLFSTTDGDGAARFATTNGNLLSGSGYTTANISADIGAAQRQFLNFKDPAGQPIFDESDVDYKNLKIIAPPALNTLFQRVSKQTTIRVDPLSNTSEDNYIVSTFSFELNSYLSGNSWYVVVNHPYYKAFGYRAPSSEGDVRSIIADINNSDHARETNEYGLYTDIRVGLSPWFPASIIKISLA